MTEDFFLFIPKRDLILKKKNTFIRQFVIEFKKIVYWTQEMTFEPRFVPKIYTNSLFIQILSLL